MNTVPSKADVLLSAHHHFQHRIFERSKTSEVSGPVLRLICLLQKHHLELCDVDQDLDCQCLLKYLLSGYKARLAQTDTEYLAYAVSQLENTLDSKRQISSLDDLVALIITLQENPEDKERCCRLIELYRSWADQGDLL